MRALLAKAAEFGVRVHVWDLPRGTRGLYDDHEKRIYLDLRLTAAERRSTLAHELGHAHHGHDCSTPAAERQARTYAAEILIDPAEFARLERVNPDAHWMAEELDVTPQIVIDYRHHCLTRVRGVTYSRPRMGIGQWAYRAAAP